MSSDWLFTKSGRFPVQDILYEELDDLVSSKNELHVVVRPSSVVHVPDPAPDSNSLVS